MVTVGVRELKARLSHYLKRVGRGERLTDYKSGASSGSYLSGRSAAGGRSGGRYAPGREGAMGWKNAARSSPAAPHCRSVDRGRRH